MNEHPNTPDEMDADAAGHVSAAYHRLPAAEPSTALDARVRAAVEAELGPHGGQDGAASAAQVIPFPWWRRASAPLAVAASLVVALGLGQWWFLEGGAQQAPVAHEQLPPAVAAPAAATQKELPAAPEATGLAAAPAPESAVPAKRAAKPEPRTLAGAPAPAADAAVPAESPRKVASAALADSLRESEADSRQAMKATSEAQRAPAPAGAERAAAAGSLQEDAAAKQARAVPQERPPAPAVRARKVEEAEPAPPPTAAPAPRAFAADVAPAPARAESAQREDPALRHVRDLLAQGRTVEARSALERWRKANPEVAVPEDLRTLLAPGGAASAPD